MAIGSLTFGWALLVRRAIFKVAKKKTLGPCSLSMVGGRGGGSVSERNLYIARSASPYQTETSQSYRRPHPLPPSPNLRSISCTQASPHTQPQRLSPTAVSGASFPSLFGNCTPCRHRLGPPRARFTSDSALPQHRPYQTHIRFFWNATYVRLLSVVIQRLGKINLLALAHLSILHSNSVSSLLP